MTTNILMDDSRLKELEKFQKKIKYFFNDLNLLENTLTHKSYANESRTNGEIKNNERLEFLGDSVLGLIISDFLLKDYPEFAEGDLSKIKGHIVSEKFLADLSRHLTIGDFLLLGKGENLTGGREKSSILADAFEALIGGIYLDAGFEKAYTWGINIFAKKIRQLVSSDIVIDYKSQLQEYTQAKLACIPIYKLINKKGPEHDRLFEIELSINGTVLGRGHGKSKKEAEQRAAGAAFKELSSPTQEDKKQSDNNRDSSDQS